MIPQAIKFKKWNKNYAPKRILVIRLQATGDVIITFPFVQLLRNKYPDTRIDYLTRETQAELVRGLNAVDNVISFTNIQNKWKQLLSLVVVSQIALFRRYEVVLDLQVTGFTKIIRLLARPKAFSEFEKFTPFTAADRNWSTFKRCGLLQHREHPLVKFNGKNSGLNLLKANGWNGLNPLIVLNPAGAFKSRNWSIENYITFAKIWLKKYPHSQFLMLGVNKIEGKAKLLENALGESFINLVSKTSLIEAFEIINHVTLIISEDSGLMHIAWAMKIPTVALIGSTDKHRSSQNGPHIVSLTSDDLPCGNCMKPDCKDGEIPTCLSRYSPEMIVKISEQLLAKNE